MNQDFSWIPGTVALSVGLLIGLWLAFRLKRSSPATDGKSSLSQLEKDLQLEIADLTARRDELYARLRGESEEEDLEADEARSLEQAAARVLRDLDRARAALGKVRPEESRQKAKAASSKASSPDPAVGVPATVVAGGPVQHHPFLWFLLGAGLMGLVGFLVFWAERDAKPDPMAAQNMASSAGAGVDHPETMQALPPAVQSQVDALEADLELNPEDFNARKQLAVLLAQQQQYFAAFQHAEKILQSEPDDPDGLYISGVVRLAMGRADEAVTLLDRVLEQFPGHVLAHLGRGAALLRLERRDEALAAWKSGLGAAGGSNPDIEGMIAQEFGQGALAGGVPAPPPAARPPMARPPMAGPTTTAPPVSADDGEPKIYRVFIELASGVTAPTGASLFVSVHNAGGGPPAAVRRVGDPQFPLEITLTQDNSMTGIPLPARGMVMINLDSDGHPGTQSPDDLSAQGEATSGELAKFVLW